MTHRKRVLSLAVACLLAAACGGGGPADSPSSVPADTTTDLPPVSVLIAHRVADYDTWKAAFDAHAPARAGASCLGHYLKRGIDDASTVYVYCLATDARRLRTFLDGEELAAAMEGAGVLGEPRIMLMNPMSRDLVGGRRLPGIIVMHRVADYDAWRVEYDRFADERAAAGIVGDAVSRLIDEPDRVVVYHQAEAIEPLRAFVDSPELAAAMTRAGVVGEPEIRFIRVVDFDTY